jgi:lipopolysaccharide export system permease protein
MILAVIAAGLLAWLAFQIVPQSAQRALDIRSQALREARFARLEPGKFRSFSGNNDIVFYAESVDGQDVLHNIYAERAVGPKLEIWTAKRAVQRGVGDQQQTFVLYDGQRYEGVPGRSEFRIIEFAEGGIPITLPEIVADTTKREMRPTLQLLGSIDARDQAELQQRLSTPVMALILAILAVPLARLRPRQGRYARVGYFILVYLLYKGVLVVAGESVGRGQVPAWLGMWWVHGVVLSLALLAWWRADRMRWWRRHQEASV